MTFCNNSFAPRAGLEFVINGGEGGGFFEPEFQVVIISAPIGCPLPNIIQSSSPDHPGNPNVAAIIFRPGDCIGIGDCITIEVSTTGGPLVMPDNCNASGWTDYNYHGFIPMNCEDIKGPPTTKGKCIKIVPPTGPCVDNHYYLTDCDTCNARSINPNYNWWYGSDGICYINNCPTIKPTSYGAPYKKLPPSGGAAPIHYNNPVCDNYSNLPGSGWCDQKFSGFSSSDPSPASTPGAFTTRTYNAVYSAGLSSGASSIPLTAPAVFTLKVTYDTTYLSADYYHTEILQLDISGGTMPPGYMIRESPTHVSTGQTAITSYGNRFYYDSFFEVFTELSIDGGQTRSPSINDHSVFALQPEAPAAPTPPIGIPALPKWGLIALAGLVLCTGIYYTKIKAG